MTFLATATHSMASTRRQTRIYSWSNRWGMQCRRCISAGSALCPWKGIMNCENVGTHLQQASEMRFLSRGFPTSLPQTLDSRGIVGLGTNDILNIQMFAGTHCKDPCKSRKLILGCAQIWPPPRYESGPPPELADPAANSPVRLHTP